jgi:excinuclease ABC subunit B
MREAAADLNFEEAARMRDELKRLRATELAVVDDPTAKRPMASSGKGKSRVHKPALDEMGIASYHEVLPARDGKRPAKPGLDHMGPGIESVPAGKSTGGPRSTQGRGGMRGGFKRKGR